MRKFAVIALLAACASQALAKPPEVRYAGTWNEAVVEAKERNVPIVIVFVKQDADGGAVERFVLGSTEFIAASKKWITIYCNRDEGQPTKKVGEKVVSTVTPRLTVEAHIAAWKEIAPKFLKGEDPATPTVVWCGTDETEIGRLEGKMTSRELLLKLAEASKKTGPGLDGDDYGEAIEHLAAGDAASSDNKIGDAVREFGEVMKLEKEPGSKVVVERARTGLNRMNDSGKATYSKAMECVAAEDYTRAKKMLMDVLTNFAGLPIGKEAKKTYDEVVEKEKQKVKNGVGGDGKRR
ncbi:MAG: hypothetical protein K8T20_09185 [Planctomycetes bacterium]|nr:hypothetical protein [Planctomycetota bacterium]